MNPIDVPVLMETFWCMVHSVLCRLAEIAAARMHELVPIGGIIFSAEERLPGTGVIG